MMAFFAFCGRFLVDHALLAAAVLLVLNLVTLILYVSDKKKAKKGVWRTPEATLLAFAWAFGGAGAMIGMYVFRHKTKHMKFRILVPAAFFLQLAFILISVWAAFV